MLIQFGTIVTGASGSIGGITLARNANSAYARKKVKSVNPNTIPQQNRRNMFGANSRVWKTLDPTQQAGWNAAVSSFPYKNKLNIASTYTGFQLFSKLNNQMTVVGAGNLSDAPVPVPVDGLAITSATVAALGATFLMSIYDTTLGADLVPDDSVVVIAATRPLSFGITAPKKPDFRQLMQIEAGVPLLNVEIKPSYVALFGTLPTSSAKVWVEAFIVSTITGQVGKKVQFAVHIV